MTLDQAKEVALALVRRPRYLVFYSNGIGMEKAHIYRVSGPFVTHYNFEDKSWWPTRSLRPDGQLEKTAMQVSAALATEIIRHFQALHDFKKLSNDR